MTTGPKISVVMAVRDGAAELARTIDSVLEQSGADFELVVVDDGSTDASREIVGRYAERDPRVRLVAQPAAGLTAALARGCREARGELLARQDCGDRSLPGRLAELAARLEREPGLVLISGGTCFAGPAGERLYEVVQSEEEARAGLRAERAEDLRGPSHHGCVMFRRAAYEAVGGYREPFRVAQDLDLWLRLAEAGKVSAVPRILYEATLDLDSISAQLRDQQVAATRLAFAAAARRRRGESDAAELARAAIMTARPPRGRRRRSARAAYFMGSCLAAGDPAAARRYFSRALKSNPFHLKAWLKWARTFA